MNALYCLRKVPCLSAGADAKLFQDSFSRDLFSSSMYAVLFFSISARSRRRAPRSGANRLSSARRAVVYASSASCSLLQVEEGLLDSSYFFSGDFRKTVRCLKNGGHPYGPNTAPVFGTNTALYPATTERSMSRISILSVFRMVSYSHCATPIFFPSSSHFSMHSRSCSLLPSFTSFMISTYTLTASYETQHRLSFL